MSLTPHKITYSRRKTVGLIIRHDGTFEVKAPLRTPITVIQTFIHSKQRWVENHQQKAFQRNALKPVYSVEQIKEYKNKARATLSNKVAYWAEKMGAPYGTIRIKNTSTRWGSCSSKNNLNFHWKLVLFPVEILEYVVIHELAHVFEKNHSSRFWNIVQRYYPQYLAARTWLKTDAGKF